MKKTIVFTLVGALILVFGLTSLTGAVDLQADAVRGNEVPSFYANLDGNGNVVFGKRATAFSPVTLNRILNAYGATLSEDAVNSLPSFYASLKGGKISFGKRATAYSRNTLHQIFQAYGLEYTGGKDKFGNRATAYSASALDAILSEYELPMEEEPMVREEIETEPEPEEEPMMEEEVEPEPEPEEPMVEEVPETRPGEEVEMETEVTPTGEGTMDTDNDGVIDANDHCPNTPTGARVNEKGCWVIQIVFFEYDKAVVRSQFYEGLNDLAETLKQNPNINIEIQGNTCDIGSAPYNYRLSVRRANSVKKYLMDKGIDSNRLKVVGLGFTNPLVPNINEANRKKNRRVEFKPMR